MTAEATTAMEHVPGRVAPLTDAEFLLFRELVLRETGIALNESKEALLFSRLARRLRELGLTTFAAYHRRLTTGEGAAAERQRLINAITTNKTEFFREPHQFELMKSEILPEWGVRSDRSLRIWSAGCSTGEEPYSIAATLAEGLPDLAGWDVKILASDIDTEVLADAKAGVYDAARLGTMKRATLEQHFLQGTGSKEGLVQVRPELRRLVSFKSINLVGEPWPIHGQLDAIFCRNVSIYFDPPTQKRLFARLAQKLAPGGYLFVGHSECLHWLGDQFEALHGGIYRLRSKATPAIGSAGSGPIKTHVIAIGGVSASREPSVVKTLLGSCVSACLFDPTTRIGGMNHFLLPEGSQGADQATRYGVHAMEVLVNELMKLGADRGRLVAKVFGACTLLDSETGTAIARRNAEFVKAFLKTEGIPLRGELLGGQEPLEVQFSTHTGRARVRRIVRSSDVSSLANDERRFLQTRPPEAAEPELF